MSFSHVIQSPEELMMADFKRRGFSEEMVRAMGCRAVGVEDLHDKYHVPRSIHGAIGAIEIPTRLLDGTLVYDGRLRLLGDPYWVTETGERGSSVRYIGPRKVTLSPYFADVHGSGPHSLREVGRGLLVVEGEFKAVMTAHALNELGMTDWDVVGLRGVTLHGADMSVTHSQGLHHTLAAYDFAVWGDGGMLAGTPRKKVVICFDWDKPKADETRVNAWDLKAAVALEETKLAAKFHVLGADVKVCRLAKLFRGVEKLAIDDLIVEHGVQAVTAILAKAETVFPNARGALYSHISVAKSAMKTRLSQYRTLMWIDNCTRHVFTHRAQAVEAMTGYKLQLPQGPNGALMTKPALKWDVVADTDFALAGEIDLACYALPGTVVTSGGVFNLWKGWVRKGKDGDAGVWLDWCKMFFSKDPGFEPFFHDWVAHMVQRPWERHWTSVIFSSQDEGSGKSFTAEAIAKMLGCGSRDHAGIVGSDSIFSGFNEELIGKVFVVANEPSSDNDDHAAGWKNLRTNDVLKINLKYGAKYSTGNHLNFMVTTNKNYVTKVNKMTRRDAIYRPEGLKLDVVRKMANEARVWMNDGGYEVMMEWYLKRDVSKFNHKDPAPKTKAFDETVVDSYTNWEYDVHELYTRIKDWMEDQKLEGLLIDVKSIMSVLKDNHCNASPQYVRKAFRSVCGVDRFPTMVNVGDKTSVYVYVFGDIRDTPARGGMRELAKLGYSCIEKIAL